MQALLDAKKRNEYKIIALVFMKTVVYVDELFSVRELCKHE